MKDLKKLKLSLSLKEIKEMTKYKFTNILKESIKKSALIYLVEKQGKKGKEIQYKELEMAEYLIPNCKLTIEEKKEMFAIRNKMTNIPSNFTKSNIIHKISSLVSTLLSVTPGFLSTP